MSMLRVFFLLRSYLRFVFESFRNLVYGRVFNVYATRVFFAEGLTYDSFLVKTVPRFFKKDACFHGSDLTVLQLVSLLITSGNQKKS